MVTLYPHVLQGAWGLWYLPGSDEFHVEWTGVAEVLGGLGMLAAQVPAVQQAVPWLYNASAAGMFALAVAVTPSNIFMATHNAPGPGPKVRATGCFLTPWSSPSNSTVVCHKIPTLQQAAAAFAA